MSLDSPFSHAAFATSLDLPFPLLSDWNREAAEAFGIMRDEKFGCYRPLNDRAAFVVDTAGIVRYARVDQGIVHPDELLAVLRHLG